MSGRDARGCAVTGATPAALQAYEHALALFLSWRQGAEDPVAQALRAAPRFVMAHLLQAHQLVSSRDPQRVRAARPVLERAADLPANDIEQLHRAALAAALDDDYEGAKAWLGRLLHLQPLDVLALQLAHAFDHYTGDAAGLRDRVAAVLPAWSGRMPGYHAVLAMHAFGLEESGAYAHAERCARAALALNPHDARAHHVMAHVFEMTARPGAGIRWMNEHVDRWGVDTVVATHGNWHLALFHLALGAPGHALALYDRRVRSGPSQQVADLIDAAALLWRIQLDEVDAGPRWTELADAWAPHIDDAFCSFNDLHAMLAFVGARDWGRARRLDAALVQAQTRPTRHGRTTRQFGLGACRALVAFGHGEHAVAAGLLGRLPALAHRLGGSHAQRDVLNVTLQRALDLARSQTRGRLVQERDASAGPSAASPTPHHTMESRP